MRLTPTPTNGENITFPLAHLKLNVKSCSHSPLRKRKVTSLTYMADRWPRSLCQCVRVCARVCKMSLHIYAHITQIT